ncbi:MAG: DUF930 domain-containing protein [Pseudomonadota bacterium]
MPQKPNSFPLKFTSGSVASVALHVFVLAFIAIDLPVLRAEPDEPEAIQVELVQPAQASEPEPPAPPEPVAEPVLPELPQAEPEKPVEARPPAILRPVTKFAEEDAGAKEPPERNPDTEVAEEETSEDLAEEETVEEQSPPEPEVTETSAAEPEQQFAAILRPATPVSRPARPARPAATPRSRSRNTAPVATTAKRGLTRAERGGSLCHSKLGRQLQIARAPRLIGRVSRFVLAEGNVLETSRGAFQENLRWFNVKFRCEVDDAATEVVSFDMEIGTPIPRSEWASRNLSGT